MRSWPGVPTWARAVTLSAAAVLGLPLAAAGALAAGAASGPARPGCALVGIGATGPAVAALQAAVGTGPDGDFGPLTQHAVRGWQAAHRLAPTGTVDAAMWAALPVAFAGRACGQPVRLPVGQHGCDTLARGDRGADTAAVQRALGLPVDGIFGSMTAGGVLAVQRRWHLPATGQVNPATFAALGLAGSPVCPARPGGSSGAGGAAPGPAPVAPPHSASSSAQRAVSALVAAQVASLSGRPDRPAGAVAQTAVDFARRQLGVPYLWGGVSRRGYDCSGLILASYQAASLLLARTAAQQYAEGSPVPLTDLRPGDVVFYASNVLDPASAYHDALYVGGGKMIEAAHPGSNVREVPLRAGDLLPHAARPTALLSLPVRSGSSGFAARQVQARLVAHGYRVTVDGGFGPRTAAAVRSMQRAARLPITGVVDDATWLVLAR
ncbi:MAG TPA: peptidoglycan-binding protein [Mycobacteriales bacterium]|nr:peptidoglycan-binding protein [Mycobacteriales bacterium]